MATFFKCTRPDGTDFYTGTHSYLRSLETGKPLKIKAGPATGNVCGVGFHVSPTARQTIQFADRTMKPWRWFEVSVEPEHIVESDSEKSRVSELLVTREIFLADIFGADIAKRIEAVNVEIETWGKIPWLKPAKRVAREGIESLFRQWHAAISLWTEKTLPEKLRITRTFSAAEAAAAAAAADSAAADSAAESAAAAAAADDYTEFAIATAVAEAADTSASAADGAIRMGQLRWYVRPYRCFLRSSRWVIAGIERPNPWQPMIEIYKLGCLPIGYANDEFIVYVPQVEGI